MLNFQEGYQYFVKNAASFAGSTVDTTHIQSIEAEITNLKNNLSKRMSSNNGVASLSGFVFEDWHAGTFNIDAAIKESKHRAYAAGRNTYASPDIVSNFGLRASCKRYRTAKGSVDAQAISHKKLLRSGESLKSKGLSSRTKIGDSVYKGQKMIVPKDQYAEGLKRAQEKADQANYRDVARNLTDRFQDKNGVSSKPIAKNNVDKIAANLKEDKLNIERDLLWARTEEAKIVLNNSIKAGMSAASLSIALKTAPEIYKTIAYLVETGEVDGEQLKSVGFSAVSGGAEGFLTGSVTAALTTVCKAGADTASRVTPELISSLVVLTMNSIHRGFDLAAGKTTKEMAVQDTMRDMFVSGCAYGGGVLGASIELYLIKEAYFGYMIGSFVGSVVGAFLYDKSRELALSFCVESGFTMFGLVEQDYSLPQEVWDSLGLASFDFESFETESVCSDTFEIDTFEVESFLPDSLGIKVLRRGVIGVSKIGYIV